MSTAKNANALNVMVVDDSALIRKLITDSLLDSPDIASVIAAPNGEIALRRLAEGQPDIITLDVEMPGMDGLQTLREIRKLYPNIPVIMFSAYTEEGAAQTLEALNSGAADYVTKPSLKGGAGDTAKAYIHAQLLTKLRSLVKRRPSSTPSSAKTPLPQAAKTANAGQKAERVDIVVVGISTGGPDALTRLLPQISATLPVPILIVQHMPPLFTKMLVERLAKQCQLPIFEGQQGMRVQPGNIYLAPGDFHMLIQNHGGAVISLNQEAHVNSCRPAADPLFESAVTIYGPHVLALVLTGMGNDGTSGCRSVKAHGGQVVVQDEDSSVVWGMPGQVAHAGLADKILPLNQIASEIEARCKIGRTGSV